MSSIVAILGGVGVGKTTLLRYVDEHLGDRRVMPVYECVDRFQLFGVHNPLKLSYENPILNCAITQLHIVKELNSHLSRALSAVDHERFEETIILSDRSIYSPHLFTNSYFDLNYLSEFTRDFIHNETTVAAQRTLESFRSRYVGAVFLTASPTLCYERIQERSRSVEESLTIDFLEALEKNQDEFIRHWQRRCGDDNVLTLKTTDVPTLYEQLVSFLKRFCK